MGILDRLFGNKDESERRQPPAAPFGSGGQARAVSDEQALQRYRYMVQTAPPETIEQAHEEAFARLTPAQRAQVLRGLASAAPEQERAAIGDRDDPKTLARLTTRAEMRQPGIMERTFGGAGAGMGGMMAGTIFGSLVAGFVGSMIAQQFFDQVGFDQAGFGEQFAADQPADSTGGDVADAGGFGTDFGGDLGDI